MRLMEMLPDVYARSEEVAELQDALQASLDTAGRDVKDFLAQFSLPTATWGLAWYERALGIVAAMGDSDELRRRRIRAKMQGQGVTTVLAVKSMVEGFTSFDVQIRERAREYLFDVVLLGTLSSDFSASELDKLLRAMIPAHLDFDYIFLLQVDGADAGAAVTLRYGGKLILKMEGVDGA